MSYRVRLDKDTLQAGRAIVRGLNMINCPGLGNVLPPGAVSQLDSFIQRADGHFARFLDLPEADGMPSVNPFQDDFLPAVTFFTIAAELAQKFAIERVSSGGVHDPALFVAQVNRLLNRLHVVVHDLISRGKSRTAGGGTQGAELYLAYAMHVTDLALAICRPPDYVSVHPKTRCWCDNAALVRRHLAAILIEQAQSFEASLKG